MGSRLNNKGTYDPSWFTLWLATHSKSTYVTQEHPSKYQGNKPILVVCTDDGKMEMKNGKVFNSLSTVATIPLKCFCQCFTFVMPASNLTLQLPLASQWS